MPNLFLRSNNLVQLVISQLLENISKVKHWEFKPNVESGGGVVFFPNGYLAQNGTVETMAAQLYNLEVPTDEILSLRDIAIITGQTQSLTTYPHRLSWKIHFSGRYNRLNATCIFSSGDAECLDAIVKLLNYVAPMRQAQQRVPTKTANGAGEFPPMRRGERLDDYVQRTGKQKDVVLANLDVITVAGE
jgi:hypothetical protein